MDFEALLCSVPGPHSIGMLFPFTQREIIETEGEEKKGKKDWREKYGVSQGFSGKQAAPSGLGSHPSLGSRGWEAATQQDSGLGRDGGWRASCWDSRLHPWPGNGEASG